MDDVADLAAGPESAANRTVLSRAVPSSDDNGLSSPFAHCSTARRTHSTVEARSSSSRTRTSRSSKRSGVWVRSSSGMAGLPRRFPLRVCDPFLLLPCRVGGFTRLCGTGLFCEGRNLLSQFGVLTRKGLE